MSKTLIIGARGNVGSQLRTLLKAKGETLALATSQPPSEAEQVQLNLLTGQGLEAAFEDVSRVFLLAPPGHTNQDELLGPVITQAQKHKVKKVVLMTAMGADANPEAPMRKAEVLLENSGLPYTILRPNWFMQNFNSFWLEGILKLNQVILPAGQAKVSLIDARDIAAVAAEALFREDLNGQAFVLTGPEALDHNEAAQILSAVTGLEISYSDIDADSMKTGLLSAGLPADYVDFMLLILGFLKQGYNAEVTPHVENILGRKGISFKQYAQDYRQSWLPQLAGV